MRFTQHVDADVRRGNGGQYDPVAGTFGFVCTNTAVGRECFRSTDWPTRELAEARAAQHAEEHESGQLMPDKTEVLAAAGYEQDGQGGVRPITTDEEA